MLTSKWVQRTAGGGTTRRNPPARRGTLPAGALAVLLTAGPLLLAALISTPVWRRAGKASAARRRRRLPMPRLAWMRSVSWKPLVVLAHVSAAFFAVNYLLPGRVSAELNLYVAQPAIWGSLAILALFFIITSPGRPAILSRVLLLAAWSAGFHVAGLIAAGVLYGFGYSPYAREPLHMLENGFYLSTLILGVECSRTYLLSVLYHRAPVLAMASLSVVFALVLIPVSNYHLLTSPETGFEAGGQVFLPAMAQSVLASYLAVNGGFLPAFLYHGGLQAFDWFSPILPNIQWTVSAFIGTLMPLVCLLGVRSALTEPERPAEEPQRFDVSAPWIIASMLLVALLWFNTGLLGVTPSVVSGVSMEPTFDQGDLVLMREVETDDLKVGDIIQFRTSQNRVFHRIVEISRTEQGTVFVTKGDNNNTPDDPVLEEQVEGKIVFTVPKVGWIPITISKLLNNLR